MYPKEELNNAVEVLRKGGIILYPTDTVWGIGCDATNPSAVAKIYEIKKRADSKSLVLLAANLDMVCRYVKEIPEIAVQLVEVNDSPMTIVYPGAIHSNSLEDASAYSLAYNVVAEDNSVAIRIPLHDFSCDLAMKLGRPIVSTSANISGEPTPKRFSEISEEIKVRMDYIVEPSLEKSSTGKASSIIKVGIDSEIAIIRK